MKIARPPPPPVSHDGLVLISGEKQRCKVIKEKKKELFLNLFSCFVSAFLPTPAEARRPSAALPAVFELSSLT